MLYLPRALPQRPAPYHLVGSGPDRRWWRVLLAILFLIVTALVATTVVSLVPLLFMPFNQYLDGLNGLMAGTMDLNDPVMFVVTMATLIVLIPLALASTVIAQRIRPGYLLSVEGHLRWKWQLVAFAIAAAIYFPWVIGISLLSGEAELNPAPNLVFVLVLVWVLTPLQSAAEELVFRGFILQSIGTWIRRPLPSLVVGTAISAFLFALAHGSLDASTMVTLMFMALASCLGAWYTGGLEVGIAIHTANNTAIFTWIAFSGPAEVLVSEDTSVGWGASLMAGALDLITAGILIFVAKRMNIQRLHRPEDAPKPTVEYLFKQWTKGRVFPEFVAYYPPQLALKAGLVEPSSFVVEDGAAASIAPTPQTYPFNPHQPQ